MTPQLPPSLAPRSWVPETSEAYVQSIARAGRNADSRELLDRLAELVSDSDHIHDVECVNLNPATNTMNPKAATALSSGLGPRTSLGYPGAKYEMGLEAIEQIEVIAAELAAEVFKASYAEVRVPSGAMANLYAFMATCQPGDSIIVPPATIAGHVTHHAPGTAGLYGLNIHEAPIDSERYTIDVSALANLARDVSPTLITVGSSLNLTHHDVTGIRTIADTVGAKVLFDAAHLSGPIAGGSWPNPLEHGAHLMTMSTYKSLAGPTAGLLLTNDAELAERVDAIAFPGMTANFDVAKTAALTITLVDWRTCGSEYAQMMTACARALSEALSDTGIPIHQAGASATQSHAFAIDARTFGGGHQTAVHLRRANVLASAIGLPSGLDDGLRVGTNEIVRWGADTTDMEQLADLISRSLDHDRPEALAGEVTAFRSRFDTIHYTT